ncbi:hypothetical protein QBC32DRAFT_52131 [Pseudoneurospora amorphoporcata]|uniref:NAD-dependent epimerase/dehydratase domain-containing protein n=1 Tax=Pseudoneurospora amorphoporcata TaxID=241081 RepID=A0AAN6SJ26_9PEZI|nr:hypothetical protein QBC32DRAFT_52131 [Pseudoneurospora amorphoporcata]
MSSTSSSRFDLGDHVQDQDLSEEYLTSSSRDYSAGSSPLTTPALSDNEFEFDVPSEDALLEQSSTTQAPADGSEKYIMVIGGLGYIGSHTTLELLREGHNVIVVDNLSNSYKTVLKNVRMLAAHHCKVNNVPMPRLRFFRIDYRSKAMHVLLERYSKPVMTVDATSGRQVVSYQSQIAGVIHFAAYKSVVESIQQPLRYYRNNVCGLVNLLQELERFNIRNFIFSSSATVYGSKANAGLPLKEEDLVHHQVKTQNEAGETTIVEPTIEGLSCPYARTKYFGEAILADVAEADADWRIVALRYFNPVGCDPSGVLGESPRGEPTNLFPVLTQVLKGDRPELSVFGSDWPTRDGTAIRDFIHVLDVARGHIAALNWNTKKGNGFSTFNLGSGTGTTVLEAVRSLEQAAGREIPLALVDRRPGDVGSCVASTDRAAKELGWTTRESITKCAADLWNYVSKVSLRS